MAWPFYTVNTHRVILYRPALSVQLPRPSKDLQRLLGASGANDDETAWNDDGGGVGA